MHVNVVPGGAARLTAPEHRAPALAQPPLVRPAAVHELVQGLAVDTGADRCVELLPIWANPTVMAIAMLCLIVLCPQTPPRCRW